MQDACERDGRHALRSPEPEGSKRGTAVSLVTQVQLNFAKSSGAYCQHEFTGCDVAGAHFSLEPFDF